MAKVIGGDMLCRATRPSCSPYLARLPNSHYIYGRLYPIASELQPRALMDS